MGRWIDRATWLVRLGFLAAAGSEDRILAVQKIEIAVDVQNR